MIRISTKPSYKYYLLGSLLKIKYSIFLKIFYFILFVAVIIDIVNNRLGLATLYLVIFITIYSIFPLINILLIKKYYKIKDNVEYYFGEYNFGFNFASTKVEYDNSKINKIQFGKSYIFVKFEKQKFFIIGDQKDIARAKEELLQSSYKEFIEK